jgi:hypothetical protein
MPSYPRTTVVFERGRPGADREHLRPRGDFWDKVRALFVHNARVVADNPAVGKVAAAPEAKTQSTGAEDGLAGRLRSNLAFAHTFITSARSIN